MSINVKRFHFTLNQRNNVDDHEGKTKFYHQSLKLKSTLDPRLF